MADVLVTPSVTPEDIVNQALVMIGEKEITSLIDANDRARAAKRLYPLQRDAVLRAYPWNCATTYSVIPVDAAAPAWGFLYRFLLPVDCLRVLSMDDFTVNFGFVQYPSGMFQADTRFKVVGRYIHTNSVSDNANIKYIAQVTDPTAWDPLLADAIVARTAAALAIPVTGDKAMANTMMQLYQLKVREARGVDGQEGIPDSFEANDLTNFRNG